MKAERRGRTFKGIISLVILRNLWNTPNYGYVLEKEVNRCLGQKLSNGEIYSILGNLEIRDLIRSKQDDQSKSKRKYYEISDKGKKYLINQAKTLEFAMGSIEEILKFVHSVSDEIKGQQITIPSI
ncbi:MAG: PadR family transcriptional regulator [Thermoplasmatales archaeon]